MAEERLQVRKSVPVLMAAGLIWILVGIASASVGQSAIVEDLASHTVLDLAELLLFLVAAKIFVNTLEERGLFDVFRGKLVASGLPLRAVFRVTGALAFVVSPVADNLTTALLWGTVAIAVGRGTARFVPLACINIVVAANAGGAFSPFGDITTLMVWQAGRVPFADFFGLALLEKIEWDMLLFFYGALLGVGGPLGRSAIWVRRPRTFPSVCSRRWLTTCLSSSQFCRCHQA
jgi:Na+/H+ antiporter NhaD/arsenite permease-like protein